MILGKPQKVIKWKKWHVSAVYSGKAGEYPS